MEPQVLTRPFIDVRDAKGDDYICPLGILRDVRKIADWELVHCMPVTQKICDQITESIEGEPIMIL